MKLLYTTTWIIFLLLSWACETPMKVSSDYDKSASFTGYKSYSIYKLKDKDNQVSALNRDRIVNAVKSEMNKKGYHETESENADVYVNVTAVSSEKQAVSVNTVSTNYYGYGGYYRPYTWGPGWSGYSNTVNVRNYKDGSLIIDVVESGQKHLLWEGVGNKEIDKPLKDPDKQLPEAVAKIMQNFPPKNNK